MKTATLCAALLTLTCGLSAHAAETREQSYKIGADVDASGRITATQLDADVPASIAGVLAAAVEQWHFVPASHDGKPMPAHTFIYTKLKATPDNHGHYGLRISFEGNGPRLDPSNVQPRYPQEAIREREAAFTMVTATVQADGSFADISVSSQFEGWPLRPYFRDAVYTAARQWHATPEQVDGKSVATHVRVPVSFMINPSHFTAKQIGILRAAVHEETAADAKPGIPLPSDQVTALDSPLKPATVATVIRAP